MACGGSLSPEGAAAALAGGPAPDDPGQSGFIGREVAGRYRILAKLGEGGMGAVYRAEQISLKRVVALKVLRPELSAEPGLVRRFNAEAELAAKLNHPNTVTLFDFGQDASGALFIAMEYIEGQSLREVLHRGGPLPPPRALAICEQVCASLADAHARGIVHRDLKPDNVMLSRRGRHDDVVRVLDFGIAKLRGEQGDVTAMPMTQAGDLLGTPQYMAPEQIRGEKVDARTDVYALGCMLYEMVTGRLPFEGPTLMVILSKHLTEAPVPPHQRRPDLSLPPALSQVILEAMAKPPAMRPPTMELFAERLMSLGLMPPAGPGIGTGPGAVGMAAGSGVSPYQSPPPLLASPPPGVPMRRTPLPGQVTPAPGPSPTPPAPMGSRAAFPSVTPAALAQHGQRADLPAATPPVRRSRAGLWAALVILAACGGAVALFLVVNRSDGSSDNAGAPGQAAPSSAGDAGSNQAPASPAVKPDFQVTPDRPVFGGNPGGAGNPVASNAGGDPDQGEDDDDAVERARALAAAASAGRAAGEAAEAQLESIGGGPRLRGGAGLGVARRLVGEPRRRLLAEDPARVRGGRQRGRDRQLRWQLRRCAVRDPGLRHGRHPHG